MKTLLAKVGMIMLMAVAAVTASMSGIAKNSNSKSAPETTMVGYISDSMCGLKHMSGMGDDKSCTLACAKGGSKFVVADTDHKRVYQLDKTGQEKAREFAGKKVKVAGRVSGKTIRVTAIEATT
jgi:hypothetical protein